MDSSATSSLLLQEVPNDATGLPHHATPPRSVQLDKALEHIVSQTSRSQWLWWCLSAFFAVAGLLCTELHTWTLLTSRTVTGCAIGPNATIFPNATLSSCATAGLFACQSAVMLTTDVPASWTTGLFFVLLGVVSLWGFVAYILSMQNWRAHSLLPFHILVQAKSFNWSFYILVLLVTLACFYMKFATFSAQPDSVSVECGPGLPITVALLPVFAAGSGGSSGGQWGVMGASFATFWLSFAALSTLISRYAADSYADITFSSLLTCASGGAKPCQSHDGDPSPVQLALQQPFLRLPAQELDKLLQSWYDARGLKEKGHKWQDARWLTKLGPAAGDHIADAAAWVRNSTIVAAPAAAAIASTGTAMTIQ